MGYLALLPAPVNHFLASTFHFRITLCTEAKPDLRGWFPDPMDEAAPPETYQHGRATQNDQLGAGWKGSFLRGCPGYFPFRPPT